MDKIAILSNITVDLIISNLKDRFEIYSPVGFDTWQQEIFNESSELFVCDAEMIFIILYIDKFADEWQTIHLAKKSMDIWTTAIKQLSLKMSGVPICVSTLDFRNIGCEVASCNNFASELEFYWENRITEIKNNVYILPLKEKIRSIGRKVVYSDKAWYLSNSPFSLKGMVLVSDLIKEFWFYLKGNKKKCLVVDLDNTLWGGVIGEDGINGIILSNHKEGSCYYNMQKCLKKIKDQGILLAIISKNNQEDVKEVFENHPFMILKLDDFAAEKINWDSKPTNITNLASELNIGLESFVFLDDNPLERAQMESECPEVTVIDFPNDISDLPSTVRDIYNRYFKSLNTTQEDLDKTWQYQQRKKRETLKDNINSIEDYLKNLEIIADIHVMRSDELQRTFQLIKKTNQFNVTTIRYSEKELVELAADTKSDVITVKLEDRFGTEGLTSVMILKYRDTTAIIDTFLMSCRVMGRKLEFVMMSTIKKWLQRLHPEIKTIESLYIKTLKNKPVENLYDLLGFDFIAADGDENEAGYIKRYRSNINNYINLENIYKEIHAFE